MDQAEQLAQTPVTALMPDSTAAMPVGSPGVPPVVPGYTISRLLGRGGMGEVWLAQHETLHRTVALKILRSELARDPVYVERFLREARSAARLSHRGVVTVHDAGQAGGSLFLAMEYMPGGDLRARLASGRGLPVTEAMGLIAEVADALQAIHEAGLVHRDLKPENLLLDAEGRVKIADLGLARTEHGDDRMTTTGQAMGTPAYMSPEQAKGLADVDARSDVYALGATLFALLTGRPPFTGATPWVVVAQVMNEPPPDAKRLVPAVSAPLAAFIQRVLAKERDRRPVSAKAFVDELRRLGATASSGHGQFTRSHPVRGWPWSLRRVFAVIAVVVVIGGGSLIAVLSTPASVTSAPPPTIESQTAAGGSGKSPFSAIRDGFRDMKTAVRGRLRESVPASLERTIRAVRTSLRRQGLVVIKDRSDATGATVETRLADGEDLTVILRPVAGGTEVAIQIGAFGDQQRARTVLDWITAEL